MPIDKTIDYLVHRSFNNVDYFLLQILPGTELRRRAENLNITYDHDPPYYVTGTRGRDKLEIGKILSHAARRIEYLNGTTSVNPFLSSFAKGIRDGF